MIFFVNSAVEILFSYFILGRLRVFLLFLECHLFFLADCVFSFFLLESYFFLGRKRVFFLLFLLNFSFINSHVSSMRPHHHVFWTTCASSSHFWFVINENSVMAMKALYSLTNLITLHPPSRTRSASHVRVTHTFRIAGFSGKIYEIYTPQRPVLQSRSYGSDIFTQTKSLKRLGQINGTEERRWEL